MEVFFVKLADTWLVKTSESFQMVTCFQVFPSTFCAYLNRYSPRPLSFRNRLDFIDPAVFREELKL